MKLFYTIKIFNHKMFQIIILIIHLLNQSKVYFFILFIINLNTDYNSKLKNLLNKDKSFNFNKK